MIMCSVEGCEKEVKGKGYCNKHYTRLLRHKDPLFVKYERHGMQNTSEYTVWQNIKERCYNKKRKLYKNYGGRGITVCERWLHSFNNFYEDMGNKPFKKAQIDRINNNEGYCKENCRWVTHTENMRNKSNNVLNEYTVRSIRRLNSLKRFTQREMCSIYNIKYGTLQGVLYNETWREVL